MTIKIKLSTLQDTQTGRAAFVLGGGQSLPGDYARLTRSGRFADPVRVAVNYHAQALGIPAEYMVYNDQPEADPVLWEAVKLFDGLRVSSDPSSDIEFDRAVWSGSFSSNTAAWFALFLGCDPVILCGMDCYQGGRIYPHDLKKGFDCPAYHLPLEDHLRPWREDGLNLLPHPERIRIASGPLAAIFPLLDL